MAYSPVTRLAAPAMASSTFPRLTVRLQAICSSAGSVKFRKGSSSRQVIATFSASSSSSVSSGPARRRTGSPL
ncbi:MAG: hypothetical protein BWY88_00525 [Synergistetes bacterium ADurb.Bin520]|nr:MAG: hypothetical protein BWY88_00525 [Synergistetes bacterium ADurb.Bin520]